MVAETVPLRQVAADMPEFLEVVRLQTLGGFDPERSVAARPAATRNEIFALHILGQREEGLCLVLGTVDQRVGNAVIGDDREAIFLEALAQLLSEAVGVAFGVL